MTEAYNDALTKQIESNVWRTLADEAPNMPNVQRVQLAADIAGIFDPTPASDAVGAVTSAVQGDWLGVGLSFVGMVPWVGDIAKIKKITDLAPVTGNMIKLLLRRSDELASAGRATREGAQLTLDQVAATRRQATERVRNAMREVRNGNPNCRDRRMLGRQRRSRMPDNGDNGTWRGGVKPEDGNAVFEFAEPKTLPDGRVVDSIKFRDRFPFFDAYVVGGRHQLWEMTGEVRPDSRTLTRQMRESNPGYSPPAGDYTLHHFEDGSVGYVPSTIHNTGEGGVAHTGGASITNNDLF